MRRRLAEEWTSVLLACQFLTRLPVRVTWSQARMAAAPRWYPAVGMLVGALAAGAYAFTYYAFTPGLAAVSALAAAMIVTGCLHEDGFADVCDGLGGAVSRERALEIMRDSRLGTYGVAGLVLMILAKGLALAELPFALALPALIAAHAASRASCVLVLATGRYARTTGAAQSVEGGVGRGGVLVALGLAALASMPLFMLDPTHTAGAITGLVAAHGLTRRWFGRRLDGYTGDCLGAIQQTGELGFYLGLLAWS